MRDEIDLYNRDIYSIMERVLIAGDLEKLNLSERISYYMQTCHSLGLNPLTRPFDYIKLPGRGLVLYARKDCTDQLRTRHKISFDPLKMQQMGDVYVVTIVARTVDGRTDSDIGVISTKGLSGTDLSNSLMKAVTKAKRRVTLSICGLGWLDESERDGIPQEISLPKVDMETGEILEIGVAESPQENGGKMTETQHRAIEAKLSASGLDREQFKLWMIDKGNLAPGGHLTNLSRSVASALIQYWDEAMRRYQDWALRHEEERGDAACEKCGEVYPEGVLLVRPGGQMICDNCLSYSPENTETGE